MIKIPSTMFTPLFLLFAGFLSPCLAKKKILCLHGGGGTGEGFANAPGMRDLEQALPDFEFVYANGGYPVAGFEETKEAFGTQSGHLWIPDPPGGKGEPTTDRFISDASIEALDEIRDNEGPFAGILGYSQGAAYVAVYLSRVPQDTFEFAMSFCGYPTLTHLGITDVVEEMTPFDNMTSLIWIGKQDSVIPNYLTRETIPFYQSPVAIESDQGGHNVPGRDDATFDEVVSFIESHRGDGNSEPDISSPDKDGTDTHGDSDLSSSDSDSGYPSKDFYFSPSDDSKIENYGKDENIHHSKLSSSSGTNHWLQKSLVCLAVFFVTVLVG